MSNGRAIGPDVSEPSMQYSTALARQRNRIAEIAACRERRMYGSQCPLLPLVHSGQTIRIIGTETSITRNSSGRPIRQ